MTLEHEIKRLTLQLLQEWADQPPPGLTFVDYLAAQHERLMRELPAAYGVCDTEEAPDAPRADALRV